MIGPQVTVVPYTRKPRRNTDKPSSNTFDKPFGRNRIESFYNRKFLRGWSIENIHHCACEQCSNTQQQDEIETMPNLEMAACILPKYRIGCWIREVVPCQCRQATENYAEHAQYERGKPHRQGRKMYTLEFLGQCTGKRLKTCHESRGHQAHICQNCQARQYPFPVC